MVFRAWIIALAATALLVSCAPSTSPDTSELASGTSNPEATTPASTTLPAPTTSQPEREAAPDFTLQLGNGSTFTLSAEPRPIFMVFWAEW